ncbi:MAG: phage head closure protein [Anaerolineae bacterium]|nr:phage head closure protein [Anaerolineae bacterium]
MKLRNQTTNPGELRTPVLFQNPTVTKDPGGAQVIAWTDLDTAHIKIVNAHGEEVVTSDASKNVQRSTWLRRYNASVTSQTSGVLDGQRWQVIAVDDIQNRHEYMELLVELAKATV